MKKYMTKLLVNYGEAGGRCALGLLVFLVSHSYLYVGGTKSKLFTVRIDVVLRKITNQTVPISLRKFQIKSE